MRTPSTLAFVLRWHGLQFIGGLAVLVLGGLGWASFTPDPPGLAYQSGVDMVGTWPYLIACVIGAGNALRAWSKGSRQRFGG